MKTSRILTAAAIITAFAVSSANAQQSQTVRVAGTIEGVDGPTVVVKQQQGGEARVNLAGNVTVFAIAKATLADIKPNSFLGVGATPQADGSQKAIRVVIFHETQRGTGEGHRPWDRPNTTMTNATVDTTVSSVNGQVLIVKYKDGEKKIIVGPDAIILANLTGEKSEVKAGAKVAFPAATKKPDGTFEASRVNVGRGDVVP
jgi:hypothetical protein